MFGGGKIGMPIYEFECKKCGIFDEVYGINSNIQSSPCPKCGELANKIMSSANFKVWKYAHKPLKKSKPKSYIPSIHDIKRNK
jgi:putative FmdB family regulatory protein